jgi:hypothetical protein
MPDALSMNSALEVSSFGLSPRAIASAFAAFSASTQALNAATSSSFDTTSAGA